MPILPCSDTREWAQFREDGRPASRAFSDPNPSQENCHPREGHETSYSVVDELVSHVSRLLQTHDFESTELVSQKGMTFAEELAVLPPFSREFAQLPTLVRGTQDASERGGVQRWICRDTRNTPDHLVHMKGPQPFREAEYDPTQERPVGIGAHFEQIGKSVFCVSLVKNGPASRSRICVGDKLISVDRKTVRGKAMHELAKMILGKEGTKITLVLKHQGTEYQVDLLRLKPRTPLRAAKTNLKMGDESLPAPLPSFQVNVGEESLPAFLPL